MNYTVIVAPSSGELEQLVRALISEGWEPIGGVACVAWSQENARKGYDETQSWWAQAMVTRYVVGQGGAGGGAR